MTAELRQVRLRRALGQEVAVDASAVDFVKVVDLDARHVLHCHHALGREVPVHIGHLSAASKGGTKYQVQYDNDVVLRECTSLIFGEIYITRRSQNTRETKAPPRKNTKQVNKVYVHRSTSIQGNGINALW